MAHSVADDHANPTQQCTALLATDNKNSVLAEVVAGRTNQMAYSAYGHLSAQQEVATSLGFNGELREARIGWYLLGNGYRAYNPRLMRFHSPDSWSPFGAGGLNALSLLLVFPALTLVFAASPAVALSLGSPIYSVASTIFGSRSSPCSYTTLQALGIPSGQP